MEDYQNFAVHKISKLEIISNIKSAFVTRSIKESPVINCLQIKRKSFNIEIADIEIRFIHINIYMFLYVYVLLSCSFYHKTYTCDCIN